MRLDLDNLTGEYLFKQFNILVKVRFRTARNTLDWTIESIKEIFLPEGIQLITDGLRHENGSATQEDLERWTLFKAKHKIDHVPSGFKFPLWSDGFNLSSDQGTRSDSNIFCYNQIGSQVQFGSNLKYGKGFVDAQNRGLLDEFISANDGACFEPWYAVQVSLHQNIFITQPSISNIFIS